MRTLTDAELTAYHEDSKVSKFTKSFLYKKDFVAFVFFVSS